MEEYISKNNVYLINFFLGIPLVTVCYLLVNISYLTVMSPSEMMISDAVAVVSGVRFTSFFNVYLDYYLRNTILEQI